MSPKLGKAIRKYALVIAVFVGAFVLYALSLRPVLWLYDTAHADAGYNSLPAGVRLFYYPLQHCPWPAVCQRYLLAGYRSAHKPYAPTEAERAVWPKTVDDAVTRLISGMNDEDKARVRNTKKDDLISFHHGWGTGIRNDFELWRGNTNLMASCQADHPDGASMVIIEAVWQRLQKP